jgi:CheY-like chemotaxis protein
MITDEQFLEYLHDALYHLYEPDRLRTSPLAALLGVAHRLDTFAALQRILVEAISALEPAAEEPPSSSAWEIYEPLFYRFVQQQSQQQVARQLGMSVRHLRRKEHVATEVLAAHLWGQFKLETERLPDQAGQPEPNQPVTSPSVAEELAWLKNTPPESPTDLSQALPHVLHLVEPLAGQYNVTLETSLADHLPYLPVHEVALNQTLVTLLGEAIRCTAGGQVSIMIKALPAEVEIRIQSESSSNTRSASKPDLTHLELAQELVGVCEGKLEILDSEKTFEAVLMLPALEQLPVLVVDDNADTLQLLRRYTASTRYRLFTTQNPELIINLIEKFSPKIIVVDVMMPRLDGWTVLAQLRQHPLTERIPIIVCTILPQEEMALALGASSFVHKPITRQAFLESLDQQVRLMETGPG